MRPTVARSAGAIRDMSSGIELRFLGLRELVANKSATGRTKDKLDIELGANVTDGEFAVSTH